MKQRPRNERKNERNELWMMENEEEKLIINGIVHWSMAR